MNRWRRFETAIVSLGLAPVLLAVCFPQPLGAKERLTVWDLKLGSSLDQMPPVIEFKGYACGSNGGPPRQRLKGWSDFKLCQPEASGLYEVYFEYDDEAEYIARAHEDARLGRDIGTVDKSFPVVTSALFDGTGTLRGIRLVTDARWEQKPDNEWANLRSREEHYLLAAYLAGQFHLSFETDCVNLPLEAGESAIGKQAVKRDCEKVDPAANRRYVIQQRLFRKEGQSGRDPHTGALTQGQYISLTRAEVYLADMPDAD